MAPTKNEEKLHVVMLPWCAFGHLIPFFQLSKCLARAGVSVSFVSTSRNIQRLPDLPPDLETLINLVSLPMPHLESDQSLPAGAEATVDLPSYDSVPYLKIAYDLLQDPFRHYVQTSKPDWILVDVIPHWAADVAGDLGVPLMLFSVFTASTLLFLGPPENRHRESLTCPPEWVDFPSSVAFRGFEAEFFQTGLHEQNPSGISDAARFAKLLLVARAVAVRSCYNVEGPYLSSYAKLVRKDVIPTGLLIPDETTGSIAATDGEWGVISQWLNRQKEKSVVFVGFGSECKLTREQVFEIARGLELSELPFLWALRRPSWAADDANALPSDFIQRTADRGVVMMGWAPQKEILAHGAIGASMFHSGWGSAIEALQFGHCLVVLPLILDQGLNARFLVEKGLAVEVERNDDGSFSGEIVAKSLRLAMVEKEGEAVRAKAREAITVSFGDKKLHGEHYINGLVQYLKNGVAIH